MPRTGLITREEMLLHRAGPGHPERPARVEAIVNALKASGLDGIRVPVEPAYIDDLLRVHSREHVERIRQTCATHSLYPDPDTQMAPESWPAALVAVGGVLAACRAVLEGRIDNAFCATRPPGHHAERDRAMGFCLFNNVAIAARWLRDEAGVKKVAILDWDVHHGNGTQQAFYDDDTVYVASIHQHPLFPGTGFPEERGSNNTNLNVPMEWGNGPREWLRVLDARVVPELERFAPDFLLISCGFDAHRLDPLANQELDAETFAEMTRKVLGLAGGRIVSVLEGGYNLQALRGSAVAHFRVLHQGAGA